MSEQRIIFPSRPNQLKELCQKYNLTPSKKYGQNYLISDSPIKKMIESADLKKSDTVVEIGPGFGVLTFALAENAGKVVSFEIERKLEDYWEKKQKEYKNVEIIWGNVLSEFIAHSSEFSGSYKVVANLPYQITSNVLRVMLEAENKPESVTVMVQKEVAERIVAKPGDMSVLAVSVQYFGKPKIIAKVSKGNFWPVPKVDSAILNIKICTRPETPSCHSLCSCRLPLKGGESDGRLRHDDEFFQVVKAGFANKRKQLWRNLSDGLGIDGDVVKKILIDVVGNEKVRAQELSVEEWLEISRCLNVKLFN